MNSYCTLVCKKYQQEIDCCKNTIAPLNFEIFQDILEIRYRIRAILIYFDRKCDANVTYLAMQNEKLIILCKLIIFISKKYNQTNILKLLNELRNKVDMFEKYESHFTIEYNTLCEAILKNVVK